MADRKVIFTEDEVDNIVGDVLKVRRALEKSSSNVASYLIDELNGIADGIARKKITATEYKSVIDWE